MIHNWFQVRLREELANHGVVSQTLNPTAPVEWVLKEDAVSADFHVVKAQLMHPLVTVRLCRSSLPPVPSRRS